LYFYSFRPWLLGNQEDSPRSFPFVYPSFLFLLSMHTRDSYGRLLRSGFHANGECAAEGGHNETIYCRCRRLRRASVTIIIVESPSTSLLDPIEDHGSAPALARGLFSSSSSSTTTTTTTTTRNDTYALRVATRSVATQL